MPPVLCEGKMQFFYELVIRLPNDLDLQVPGIPEECADNLLHSCITLPPKAKWDMALVEYGMVSMASVLVRIIVCFWQMLNPLLDCPYYIQFEEGQCFYHLHCLLSWRACDSLVLGRHLKKMKERIVLSAFGGCEPNIPEWFAVNKTKVGGKNKLVNQEYIETYLLPKRQREVQWAWTDIPEYEDIVLDAEKRALYPVRVHVDNSESSTADSMALPGPSISGSAAENYSRLVDWLVEEGITSEREWLLKDKKSYRSFHANSNSSRQIKAALENARSEMMLTRKACHYLVGSSMVGRIEQNKIFNLFCLNNYSPQVAGKILYEWGMGLTGKRNTVWLTGPASTGKTNLAEAIAHCVPLYGCVNWNNQNFPFNDCVGKMLIWWEEGKMTAQIVEAAKAILGGSKVRVDQKCKSSIQVDPTPVIITSNVDMTLVLDGNVVTHEHEEPLQHRMWKFTLDKVLPPDWGKITKEEVQDFFCWAKDLTEPVAPTFEVPHLAGGGVLVPEEIDLTEEFEDIMPEAPSVCFTVEVDGSSPPSGGPGASSPRSASTSSAPLPEPETTTLKEAASILCNTGIPAPSATGSPSGSTSSASPETKRRRYEYRYQGPYVCLDHNVSDCQECGPEQCLFTQGTFVTQAEVHAPPPSPADLSVPPEEEEEVDLECYERMSQMSSLSSLSDRSYSPLGPTPPYGSPVPLSDLFGEEDDSRPTFDFRFHPH